MDDQTNLAANEWTVTVAHYPSCNAEVFCFPTEDAANSFIRHNVMWLNSGRHASWYGPSRMARQLDTPTPSLGAQR